MRSPNEIAYALVSQKDGSYQVKVTAGNAAPIIVGRRHLIATSNRVTALLVNAGNANCATGQPGIDACKQSCVAVAEQFHCVFDEVFPSSTGIIGVPLPVVQQHLGHESIEVTVGVYGHLDRRSAQQAADAIEKLLSPSRLC